MKNKDLLPCPFCGSEAEVFHSNRATTSGHFVECLGCKSKTGFGYNSIGYAIAAWNTRTNKIPVGNGEDYEVVRK